MRLSSYANCRILALLFTVGLIAIHPYLPHKVTQLYPNPDPRSYSVLFGPEHNGMPSATWVDKEKNHFLCNYAEGDPYSCEWSLNLALERPRGIDLTSYDGINVDLRYQGNAPRIRFYLRNFDPAYSDATRLDETSKSMSTAIKIAELTNPTYIPLAQLCVAEWWITQFNVAREHSAPSLENVISFGISFNVYSHNDMQINKVEAVGEWIRKEQLYFIIILLWMAAIIFEVIWRFYLIHQKAKADASRVRQLANEFQALQALKNELEVLSTTDVLTGVMNRTGIQQILDMLFNPQFVRSNLGILIFDVDHFKSVNDHYGHDAGDAVLSTLAQVIGKNVRQSDVLGRWGGEEFILICPQISREQLQGRAEKLRLAIAQHDFTIPSAVLRVTVSIGATIVGLQEGFDAAFKRADTALYTAKNSGRNQTQLA